MHKPCVRDIHRWESFDDDCTKYKRFDHYIYQVLCAFLLGEPSIHCFLKPEEEKKPTFNKKIPFHIPTAIINHVPSDLDNNSNYFVYWMHEIGWWDGKSVISLCVSVWLFCTCWWDDMMREIVCVWAHLCLQLAATLWYCFQATLHIHAFTKQYLTAIFVVVVFGVANILFLFLSLLHVSHRFILLSMHRPPDYVAVAVWRCDGIIFFSPWMFSSFRVSIRVQNYMFHSIFHLKWLSVFICKFHI